MLFEFSCQYPFKRKFVVIQICLDKTGKIYNRLGYKDMHGGYSRIEFEASYQFLNLYPMPTYAIKFKPFSFH